jgi:UDP-N-acetylglucosamine 2-epimerase (non-hydrolysing)
VKIVHVVGARPNFMKVAPVMAALEGRPGVEQLLVHTGQHYSPEMSDLFFRELGLPEPDINLEVGSGGHGLQTGRIMERFEAVLTEHRPDVVLVVGDVNSTLACAIDAKKLDIPVIHVEAGLRSGDRSMPEEINRLATDAISDLLFTTDAGADANLLHEGVPQERIHRVGNVMIDTLLKHREAALARPTLRELGVEPRHYAVVTLHRPSNVDDEGIFRGIAGALAHVAAQLPVVFPVHPRTRSTMARFGLDDVFSEGNGFRLVEPAGYLDFLNLTANARIVLTDSGGIQEESTILGVPCLTLRHNTERPVTIDHGTNRLVGNDPEVIRAAADAVLSGADPADRRPELWDGRSAERIADVIVDVYGGP